MVKIDYGFYKVRTVENTEELFCQVDFDTETATHHVAFTREELDDLINKLGKARNTMDIIRREEGA